MIPAITPMSSWASSMLSIAILAAFVVLSYIASLRKRRLPPGPRGLPLIGNVHQLTKRLWLSMDEWCKQYGPLVYINAAGQPIIIIGSHKAAEDLLDKRAGIYSDRPQNIVVGELLTAGLALPIARHNNTWRRMRRAAHEALHKQAASQYLPTQESEATILVSTLLQTPQRFRDHLQRANNSLMISLVYGLPPILDSDDPLILWIDRVSERLSEAGRPGAHLVEFFTWMKYLPGWMCPWRRNAEAWYAESSAKFRELFRGVSTRMGNGAQTPCIAAALFEEVSKGHISEEQAAWTSIALYLGGTETTIGQLSWFILAMILHPEAQKRAHEELDQVVGRDRMPTFRDYEYLPYTRALVREVMRWRPAFPMGLPHRAEEDDHYDEYFIPKGSICFANTWSLNHDTHIYGPDASEFNPARFLRPDGQLQDIAAIDTKEEGHVAFGFGRRICVGRYVANNTMFIQVASILWALKILPGNDTDGNLILPDPNSIADRGIGLHATPFVCDLIPRFDNVPSIVAGTKDTRAPR